MPSPCCGKSLRKAVIIVASVEIVLATIGAIFYVLGLLATVSQKLTMEQVDSIWVNFRIPFVDKDKSSMEHIMAVLVSIFVLALVSCIIVIAFSTFLLLNLQRKGNEQKLKIWLIYKVVMLMLAYAYIFALLLKGYWTSTYLVTDLLSAAMHTYFLWVVWAYYEEQAAAELPPSPAPPPPEPSPSINQEEEEEFNYPL